MDTAYWIKKQACDVAGYAMKAYYKVQKIYLFSIVKSLSEIDMQH
jgi:hypothetical protein